MRQVCLGKLALDIPIGAKPYTLRQLLQHRSGVPNYGGLPAYHEAVASGASAWDRQTLLDAVGADTLDFAPGQGWAYSNVGSMMVRVMLEELLGDYDTCLAQTFPGSDFHLARTSAQFEALHPDVALRYDPDWVYHGCMIGSAQAAVALLDDLMRGAFLPPDMLAEMLRAHPIGQDAPGRPFADIAAGLGVFVSRVEGLGRVIGHPGGGPGSTCGVWHFPDLARAPTIAAFSNAKTEAVPEGEVVRIAQSLA